MMWTAEIQILNEEMIVEVVMQFKQLQINGKKFRDFNGDSSFKMIRTHGLCFRAAVLYRLSYEKRTLGAGQFVEFILTRE